MDNPEMMRAIGENLLCTLAHLNAVNPAKHPSIVRIETKVDKIMISLADMCAVLASEMEKNK